MAQRLKTLRELEGLINSPLENTQSYLVLDTSGLIDVVRSARRSRLGRNCELDEIYRNPANFLKHIDQQQPILVTPKIAREIGRHLRVKLNKYNSEIPANVGALALGFYSEAIDVKEKLNPLTDFDNIRYAIYWLSKRAFNPGHKKNTEGFSEADREILTFATSLASAERLEVEKSIRPFPVGVITSDSHVLEGIKLLPEYGFFGVYGINTRKKK